MRQEMKYPLQWSKRPRLVLTFQNHQDVIFILGFLLLMVVFLIYGLEKLLRYSVHAEN